MTAILCGRGGREGGREEGRKGGREGGREGGGGKGKQGRRMEGVRREGVGEGGRRNEKRGEEEGEGKGPLTLNGRKAVKDRECPDGSNLKGKGTAFTSEATINSSLKVKPNQSNK